MNLDVKFRRCNNIPHPPVSVGMTFRTNFLVCKSLLTARMQQNTSCFARQQRERERERANRAELQNFSELLLKCFSDKVALEANTHESKERGDDIEQIQEV